MCRGDIDGSLCQSCINQSIIKAGLICHKSKGVAVYYGECWLSYFKLQFPSKFQVVLVNPNVTTKYLEIFKVDVRILMMELMKAVVARGWLWKFATGTIAGPNSTTIYAFVQ
ncbi:hypothetical protein L1987_03767 [Smallanthus sonchifolius]|uniref:Uncharacterized protein n=1 Tax=Smallanthus sonchifolius TaxID=185202 RepID=A0ACB9KBT0_9ASTR|nr:hypothetical protein L1987_03767 [Smallanthus sonchifolius]